jgi:hypothetical protein
MARARLSSSSASPGDEAVRQADAVGLGGLDRDIVQKKAARRLAADAAGQSVDQSHVRRQADPHEGGDERCVVGGHDMVAGQGDAHGAARDGATHGGDQWLGMGGERSEHVQKGAVEGGERFRIQGLQEADIAAGGEVGAASRQDDGPHLLARRRHLKGGVQLGACLVVDRIHPVAPVQGDARDARGWGVDEDGA